jgi:hypothetical protein
LSQELHKASRSTGNTLRMHDAKLATNSLLPTLTPVNLSLCFALGT